MGFTDRGRPNLDEEVSAEDRQAYEQFLALYDESLRNLAEGEIVRGKVVTIGANSQRPVAGLQLSVVQKLLSLHRMRSTWQPVIGLQLSMVQRSLSVGQSRCVASLMQFPAASQRSSSHRSPSVQRTPAGF